MAILVPLNVFKSQSANLSSNVELLYSTPQDITTIVLMAQVANVSNTASNVTFFYKSGNTGPSTELVKGFTIYPNDAGTVLTGKLVLEQFQSIFAQAGDDNKLKITLSLLETSNQ
jgi:hypothetical protein